jgi:hypothetical protein
VTVVSVVASLNYASGHLDLHARRQYAATVAASPAAATETVICTYTITEAIAVVQGIHIFGWAAFTAGTAAVSATLKIRQTGTSGTTIATTGAVTVVATDLYSLPVFGVDTSPTLPGQVYVLTLTMGSGSATSTVSAVGMDFTIV